MKKILYTDQTREATKAESIGMLFAMIMLFIVLPAAICIISSGF